MIETIANAALAYAKRGWKPVPVSRKSKKPIGSGWQQRPFDPVQFNGNAQNIGIQFGAVSGGLVDVDLDCTDAIGLAPEFLPRTGAIFGRRSKPCSHHLYITDLHSTEKRAVIPFAEHQDGRQGPMIVELRIGADSKGAVTTFPPSMHVTGELVQWVQEDEPARVTGADLKRAVRQLAVACLLKRHYPGEGSRHEGALVIGGVLARAGWSAEDIAHVIEVVARAVGDDDVRDRAESAADAMKVKANGHDVAGLKRLADVWGKDLADSLAKWLNVCNMLSGAAAGLEDETALQFLAPPLPGAEQHIAGGEGTRLGLGAVLQPLGDIVLLGEIVVAGFAHGLGHKEAAFAP